MSLSCVNGARLCDGCMRCYDDPNYGRIYAPEDDDENYCEYEDD